MRDILGSFLEVFQQIEEQRRNLRSHPDQDEEIKESDRAGLASTAFQWRKLFAKHGFEALSEDALQLEQKFRRIDYRGALERLDLIESKFKQYIGMRAVFVVSKDDTHYLSVAGFGQKVEESFPSAQPEINAARRCYALNEPTASVFHLMRAIEHLLRAFVVGAGVPTNRSSPLVYQTWNSLIEQAEKKIDDKLGERWRNKAAREKARSVLRASVSDFYSFKDSVRNVAFHTRSGLYERPTALGVMNRVENCFRRLAPHLSERDRRGSLLKKNLWS